MDENKATVWTLFATKARCRVFEYLVKNFPRDYPLVQISKETEMNKKSVSEALNYFKENNVVTARKIGKRELYRISNDGVVKAAFEFMKDIEKRWEKDKDDNTSYLYTLQLNSCYGRKAEDAGAVRHCRPCALRGDGRVAD